jgi:hypothetical protein
VSALAALMVWDALALEPRDAAILGGLPIPIRTISRAKLAAVLVFGAGFTVALNGVPSVLYPVFLTVNLRGMRGSGIVQLIAGHATSVIMAGLAGFFVVLAMRGLLLLILGERGFQRVSSAVQSVLVVCMVTALLLAPTVRKSDVHDWVAGVTPPRWPALPGLAYLGMNEVLAGRIVANTPIVLPPRFGLVNIQRQRDDAARAAYQRLMPRFAILANRAWVSWPLVTLLALATFLWTNRRLPDRSVSSQVRSPMRTATRRLADRFTPSDPEARAGFFFTLQTLTRSAPHRTIVAVSLAAGLTHTLIVLARLGRLNTGEIASTPLGLLAIDTMLLAPLVAGLRYAVTVPAELASNWTIRMAWLGDECGYLAGVKRAGIVLVGAVPLVVLLPVHVLLFGWVVAIVHAVYGFTFATILLDVLFVGYRKMPFACSYLPIENPKLLWPVGIASLLLVTYGFADVERFALRTVTGAIGLAAALGTMAFATKLVDRAGRRERLALDFDERPALATQRLGLFEHVP